MKNTVAVEVSTVPVRAVVQNAKRTSLAIANTSSTVIVYMGSDNQVSTVDAFPLYPGMIMTLNAGMGDRPDIERWLVSDAAADIRITEDYGGE